MPLRRSSSGSLAHTPDEEAASAEAGAMFIDEDEPADDWTPSFVPLPCRASACWRCDDAPFDSTCIGRESTVPRRVARP